MRNKKIRFLLSIVIIVSTITSLSVYIAHHKSLLKQLTHTPIITIASVFLLYIVMLVVLMVILYATLQICGKNIGTDENLLLNAYSLLANFFVPGQSGPIVRGVYLHRKYQLKVKHFLVASILYYSLYALVSVIFIVAGNRAWWQTVGASIVASMVVFVICYLYIKRSNVKKTELFINYSTIGFLMLATLMQAMLQMIIFAIELHSSNYNIGLHQVITYTGIANLALFVSLTPGAIGIRESFLILTQHVNHISSSSVVYANVIDRSVFLVFILALIPLSIYMGSQKKFSHFQKLFTRP